ncbi:MAG: sporulation integral rane protein YlbJ, partial [Paenibacillaceae bacterium]|nr:sporulation integral rane protein YlbJ [Paenibacillaceae bacterium]
ILTELMRGSGTVHGIGVLLEPLMKRWLGLPGCGGPAVAVGVAAGMPAGAEMTAKLRKLGLISRRDGELLLSASHLCNPVLIVVVIGVGFLNHAAWGWMNAVIHYIAYITACLALRLIARSRREDEHASHVPAGAPAGGRLSMLARAAQAMNQAKREDGRTFGKLLGDSVILAIQNLLMIGGYIMMFSVVVRMISLSGAADQLPDYIMNMLLELHLGAYTVSQSGLPAIWMCAWIGFGLALSGLSMLFQVNSFAAAADLRIRYYIVGRVIHAASSFALTFLLWNPLQRLFNQALPSLADSAQPIARHGVSQLSLWPYWPSYVAMNIGVAAAVLAAMAILSGLLNLRKLRP